MPKGEVCASLVGKYLSLSVRDRSHVSRRFTSSHLLSVPVSDSPMMTQQIRALQAALRSKGVECGRLTGEKMLADLKVCEDKLQLDLKTQQILMQRFSVYI